MHSTKPDAARRTAALAITILATTTSITTAQSCPDWVTRLPPPGQNLYGTLAFDSSRSAVVAIGRTDLTSTTAGLWSWDGQTWTLINSEAPFSGGSWTIAYDSIRQRLVAWGRQQLSPTTTVTHTAEYDGVTWTVFNPPSAPPTGTGRMVFDEHREVCVLVVADGSPTGTETWTWNGQTWNHVLVGSPASNTSAADFYLAYDKNRGKTVLANLNSGAIDTWEWDGDTWFLLKPMNRPPYRQSFAMAFHDFRGTVLLFGGSGVPYFNDLWEWDGVDWQPVLCNGAPPSGRGYAACAFDPSRNALVVAGGITSLGWNYQTWHLQDTNWSLRSPSAVVPTSRSNAMLSFDSARGVVVMFGGSGSSGLSTDTWEWTGTIWQRKLVAGPPGRTDHAMAFDSSRNQTVLFGGQSGGSYLNDTWLWDGSTWRLSATTPSPPTRARHALAYDSARQRVVLFGGHGQTTFFNDTWEWDGATWTLRSDPSTPPPTYGHAMAFDSQRGVTVLYGGYNGNVDGRTWELNGSGWSLRSTSGPGPMLDHLLAYDSARAKTILIGASGSSTFSNWEWNGQTWTQLSIDPSDYFYNFSDASAAFDSARGLTVVYDAERIRELHPCPFPPSLTRHPSSVSTCAGPNIILVVSAVAVPIPEYRWRRNTINLANGGNISGADTPTLTISPTTPTEGGNYDCVVTNSEGSATSNSATLTIFPSGSGDGNLDTHLDLADLPGFVSALLQFAPPAGTAGWVTEWISYGGHQYRMTDTMSWSEAETLAMASGGHLVTVNDLAENEWLHSFMMPHATNPVGFYIGLIQPAGSAEPTGGWHWASGEPFSFSNWDPFEPNNGDSNGEDVGMMLRASIAPIPGAWNDVDSLTYRISGVVERAPESGAPSVNYCAYDMNHDGTVSGPDIQPFVAQLLTP